MKKHYITFIFLFLAILGASITRHYSESWDELQFYRYAGHALESYSTWPKQGEIIVTGNTYDNYGPAFVIFTSLTANLLHSFNPNWLISDYRHFIYYLVFLAGVWAFHDIAKRWMNQLAAITATMLFLTQPLFWGHAFFSPKDIPFMSLFLLSLSFGFRMVDSSQLISFDSLTQSARRTLLSLSALWLVSVFSLYLFTDAFRLLIENLVRSAASGETNIISLIASDIHKVEPEVYIQRYFVFFLWARSIFFLLSSSILLFSARRHLPSVFRILPSAIILGITASTRILGPLAGLIVVYYAFRVSILRTNTAYSTTKHATRNTFIFVLTSYAILAIITMYITWPYLWPNPSARLLESFQVMSQYPWKGQVLFNGQYYSSTNLPLSYIPVLLAIQFTEPVWPLFVVGLFALCKNNMALASTLLWFVLPLFSLIITRAPLYDNTRQIFFILPPVFFVAGLGVESVFGWLNQSKVKAGIALLLILPGVVAGIRLHPYEYVYYNNLVANPDGKFELDYWAASYREAANWLNDNAPLGATIVVGDPQHIAELYLRNDLQVSSGNESPDYAIFSIRYNQHENNFAEYKTVYKIERGEMLFAVIKKK
ncbi:MAG: hypothetical protein HOP27_14435 [Anaerolineales bacterium]|nr:hypothetical protein [Anaerolineales bacterium]